MEIQLLPIKSEIFKCGLIFSFSSLKHFLTQWHFMVELPIKILSESN